MILGRKEGFCLKITFSLYETRKGFLEKIVTNSETHLTDVMAATKAALQVRPFNKISLIFE